MKSFLLILVTLALTAGSSFSADKDISTNLPSYEPWPEEAVAIFEYILLQDGGRVKPVFSYSRFTLMQFIGGTKIKFSTQDGEEFKISHTEWLMDVLFRGEIAKELPTFILDNSEAVVRIGVSPKAKRDRYSYSQLLPGRAKLADLSAQYGEKRQQWDKSEKDPQYELDNIETMVLGLGRNVSAFEFLLGQFGYARKNGVLVNEQVLPPELKEMAKEFDMVGMMERMPEMTIDQLVQAMQTRSANESEDEKILANAMRLFFFHANSGRGLNLFLPRDGDDEKWLSIGDVMLAGLESKKDRPWAIEQMKSVGPLVENATDGEKFTAALKTFAENQRSQASSREEGARSSMEIGLYKGSYFINALVFFILGFIVLAFSWLAPGSKAGRILVIVSCVLAAIGLVLDIYGITLRSIIRSRPPITNLYDTVLFITATAVLLGLILEYYTRIGIGALVATIAGVLGMFLSIKYEAKEATDTISQLVAVLDTNFWLATHVTIINIGYASAIVAALLAICYLAIRFVCLLRGAENRDFLKSLTRMTYGIVCFCLFFSLVGTVLGGIWANYSWGRFWGWDPKENGALMICLWCLVILHARMGGYIRDIGIACNAIILAGITTFSWWGVNNLGVGLHSYGFTDGVWRTLYFSWMIMGIFMLMGIPLWFSDRKKKKAKLEESSAKPEKAQA